MPTLTPEYFDTMDFVVKDFPEYVYDGFVQVAKKRRISEKKLLIEIMKKRGREEFGPNYFPLDAIGL